METKPSYLSKTVILNSIVALAGVLGALGVPMVQTFISAHTDLILTGLGLVGVGLRFISHGKLELY